MDQLTKPATTLEIVPVNPHLSQVPNVIDALMGTLAFRIVKVLRYCKLNQRNHY